jgi:hypothetical protein
MEIWTNEITESNGISNDKMYLHIAGCNILLFYLSVLSTQLVSGMIQRVIGAGQ